MNFSSMEGLDENGAQHKSSRPFPSADPLSHSLYCRKEKSTSIT